MHPSPSSTRINELHNNNPQSHADGQRASDSPHIHDSSGLRFTIDNRCNAINEQRNALNGQNFANNHHNLINERHTSINGCNNYQPHCKISNGVITSQIKISNTEQSTNDNLSSQDKPERPSDHKQNGYPTKNHENNVDHKNGINRLTNGKSDQEQLQKDNFHTAANLRQLLRPTVIEKRQESAKVEYDAEDINGPYNFRQLLRPTEYLPTESLRKRKGGLVSNGVPLPKDKVPEKHVKRRAPLAPTQNRLVNGKKWCYLVLFSRCIHFREVWFDERWMSIIWHINRDD